MKYSDFCDQFNMSPDVKSLNIDEYLIYFLLDRDRIVYVGKSSEGGLFGRLRSHQQDKEFDSYFTINSIETEDEALTLEKGFISLLRPKYNQAEMRVNIEAIQKVIQYVTKGRERKVFVADITKDSTVDKLQVAARLEQLRGKLRSYESRWNASPPKVKEPTYLAAKARINSEIAQLEKLLS